jgi:subtilisin family serine protease
MTHRTIPAAVAAVAALALLGGPAAPGAHAAARVDAAVRQAPSEQVDAIVVLRRQPVLPSAAAGSRAARLAAVLKALRDHAEGEQRRLIALLAIRRLQGRVSRVRPFWIFNGLQVVADPDVIEELAALPEVADIRPNATVVAPTAPTSAAGPEWNVARVNAPALWNLGYRGQGIVVANMDTGVDASHPDLSARWRGGTNSWYDPNGEHPTTPTDVSGHGTWTMGAMVGGDAGGTALGVAPDARWIAVKIFNDRGIATTAGIHAGFQWLLDPDGNPATADAPNVVNDSWTMTNAGCNLAFQIDLRSLRTAGILPIFSAGNGGVLAGGSSLSPANNPEAFAVGGTDSSDLVDPAGSRGPSACGQGPYPQLTAPGVNVRTTDLFGMYTAVTGTSIAAPHAAGALALLLGAAPGIDADRQAAALQNGALDLGAPGPDFDYGAGRLDVLASRQWLATAPDFSVAATPATATTPAGGSVSYRVDVGAINGFAGDVALSVSGLSASQASSAFDSPTIVGGAGSSTLTVTTAASLAPGTYPLTITGTSGGSTHAAKVSLTVPAPPDFSLAATPSSRSTLAGGAVSYTVSVGAVGGFSGTVALSLAGLTPAQAARSFAPDTIAGAGASQLTVTPAASLAPGSYPLTITGTSGLLTHTVAVTLVVLAAPDFSVSLAPASATVVAGQTTTYTVTVGSAGGFAGTVTLSASGLPSGASASFAPSSPAAPGSSTLTIRTVRTTTRGTFTLRVTGKSGTVTRQATATLVVRS